MNPPPQCHNSVNTSKIRIVSFKGRVEILFDPAAAMTARQPQTFVLLQVIAGLLLFRLPCGFHVSVCLVSDLFGFLSMGPKAPVPPLVWPLAFSTRWRQRLMNVCSSPSILLEVFHVSHLLNRIDFF